MNRCCCADNMKIATADGTVTSGVNVLTCKTCGTDFAFAYNEPSDFNVCWSFVHHAVERDRLGLKVFMNQPNPPLRNEQE